MVMMATLEVQVSRASPVDVAEFIDQQPVGGFQIRLLLTCAAVLFLDGFDTQAIGYVAPALAKEWGLSKGALGPVFSAGLFGVMIGAQSATRLYSNYGPRRLMTTGLLFLTVFLGSLALVGFSTSLWVIRAIMFAIGLFTANGAFFH